MGVLVHVILMGVCVPVMLIGVCVHVIRMGIYVHLIHGCEYWGRAILKIKFCLNVICDYCNIATTCTH